jgi:hypothetical protein
MHKETMHQVILFIITSIIIFQTGKYLIALNDIESFTDFFRVMLFFVTGILFFLNYLIKLSGKLIEFFNF